MGLYQCEVLDQIQISNNVFILSFHSPEIVRNSVPGQFVHIRVKEEIHPLLRRPFSIHRVHRNEESIELLYRVVGAGTSVMRNIKRHEQLNVMGPLGRGFELERDFTQAVIIAGGIGSAPVFFLMDKLLAKKKEISFLWGAKTGGEIFNISELKDLGVEVTLATEDGSLGHKGLVTDLLPSVVDRFSKTSRIEGFVCGPKQMIGQIQKMIDVTDWGWQASLEERMACGMGVCQGCAVKTKVQGYRMVCEDGPVFNLRDIVCDG